MGIYKRGKIWWISYTAFGKRYRISSGTSNKKLAEKIYIQKKDEILKYKFNLKSDKEITFFELIEKYRKYSGTYKKAFSTESARLNLIKDFFSNVPILLLNTEKFERFKIFLLESKKSEATINRYFALLKHMFNKSYEWFGVPYENPVKKIKICKNNLFKYN